MNNTCKNEDNHLLYFYTIDFISFIVRYFLSEPKNDNRDSI